MNQTIRVLAIAAATACLMACSSRSEGEQLAAAQAQLDKRDPTAATIHLKAALEQSPQSGRARLLLGRALLMKGDAAGALIELRRAQEGGIADEEAVPDIARALVDKGNMSQALATYKTVQLKDAAAAAALAAILSEAHAAEGELSEGREMAERALRAQPDHPQAQLMLARIAASEGQADDALSRLDAVLARNPKLDAAALLKSEVLLGLKSDAAGALAALKAMRAVRPDSIPVATALVGVLMQQGRAEEAHQELDQLTKAAPHLVGTLLLQAQVACAEQRYAACAETANRVLSTQPNQLRALLLAGAAEFQLQRHVVAEDMLTKALKLQPRLLPARQLLARNYLRMDQPDKALASLQPLLADAAVDTTSLMLLGQAQLLAGDVRLAEESFRRAAQASPKDASPQSAVALVRLARGEAGAMADLESLAKADAGTAVDMALISAKLRARDSAGALQAADTLIRKDPGSAMPLVVRGRILVNMGNEAEARRAFEAALAKSPSLFAAAEGLAGLEERRGDGSAARQRLEAWAKSYPKDARPRAALADLAARSGSPDAVVLDLRRAAIKSDPTQPRLHVALVDTLLRQGSLQQAQAAAREAVTALPDSGEVMDALGRTQLASGDLQAAVTTYKKLTVMQPRQVRFLSGLAEAHAANKEVALAKAAIQRALAIAPGDPSAVQWQAVLATIEGKAEEALAIARAAQKRAPGDAFGFALEGELAAKAGQWQAAANAYGEALRRESSSELAINRHISLRKSAGEAEANKWQQEWLRGHAKDAQFLFYLGEAAANRKDWATAEVRYREVLVVRPRHAAAMNNIAWLLAKQGKPGAVAMAEQALALLPERPGFLDTLSTALQAESQLDRALEVQKRAVELDNKEPMLRWRLAQLLLERGDKAEARKHLEMLSLLGSRFAGQEQVSALLKAL